MTTPPVTPPVAPDPVKADVIEGLTLLQRYVKADKSAVVAAGVHIAVLLVAALRLHLSAEDTAILGSIVAAGVSYFINLRLPPKL